MTGWLATQLPRSESTWLPRLGSHAGQVSEASAEATEHRRAEDCAAGDLGESASEPDQEVDPLSEEALVGMCEG